MRITMIYTLRNRAHQRTDISPTKEQPRNLRADRRWAGMKREQT